MACKTMRRLRRLRLADAVAVVNGLSLLQGRSRELGKDDVGGDRRLMLTPAAVSEQTAIATSVVHEGIDLLPRRRLAPRIEEKRSGVWWSPRQRP